MTPQRIRDIHTIVVHCSATDMDRWIDASDIDRMHKARGWSGIGYHDVIRLDGTIEQGRAYTQRGAHVKGNNTNTVGICLVGGCIEGQPVEGSFTQDQLISLAGRLWWMRRLLPALKRIVGHRDYSPDLNGDGLITPDEWIKQCPCMDVGQFLSDNGLAQYRLPVSVDVRDIV